MSLHPLEAHDQVREAVARAAQNSELPKVLLLHGPRGVGKQRLALWIGQLLLCEDKAAERPCGGCSGCRASLRLEHPDLLWYFPIRRPSSRGSAARDQEAFEEARVDRLAHRKDSPLRASHADEPLGLHLGTVRNLKREAQRGATLAARRVFVLADAEELVSQEASLEAANALLKVLEEPPDSCWFVLTSSEPGRLLPTIRSRTVGLHTPPLSERQVQGFLSAHMGATPEEIERAARLCGGSIGRALGFLPADGELGPLERIRQEAFHLLRASLGSQPSDRFAVALAYSPAGARGLHELLSSLETWIRDLAALAASPNTALLNHDARQWLTRAVADRSIDPRRAAECVRYVEDSRALAAGNVNPQLILIRLLSRIRVGLQAPQSLATDKAS